MFALAGPGIGMFQHCRKGWYSILSTICLGASSWMIMSVIAAQMGHVGEKFRYFFSQIMLMASFLAVISRRPSPPSCIGWHRVLHVILGEESSSYIKLFIILFRVFSMCLGIPCALARNWVWPPTTAWIISFLLFRVGWRCFHLSRLLFILSIIVSQGASSFVWFPIQAPSILIDSPSLATCILSVSRDWSLSFSFLMVTTLCLCSVELMGMISVFSMLNFVLQVTERSELR